MRKPGMLFAFITILTAIAAVIALPAELPIRFEALGRKVDTTLYASRLALPIIGSTKIFELKRGLDIQGGMQVVLQADTSQIPLEDQAAALESSREVIQRRVDLFGISEPSVRTAKQGTQNRILVDLPGVQDPSQALRLLGTTAQLDFRLEQASPAATILEATSSAVSFFSQYQSTGLTGKQLKRAQVQFDQTTGKPIISLEFNDEGRELFGNITTQNTGRVLAIFLDELPVAIPTINDPILDGRAVLTGGFTLPVAKQLAIQLNAGALPVPVAVLEQRQLGASLGQQSVEASIRAGLIGLGLVVVFMIMLYGWKGVIASWALLIYSILTIALYKLLGVTLTLPGIAGLLLSIGMAVDANILIFERLKEELRVGKPFERAMELAFGRAWDSIKDANLATILTSLVLINPLDFSFLNTSGLVRGFGVTLLIGVLVSLFTGVVVTRTLMRLFLKGGQS